MSDTLPSAEDVLSFWLGKQNEQGLASAEVVATWWKKDPAFDRRIAERFDALHGSIVAGEHDAWLDQPRSRLAYIVVTDQLSRNMYRDTPRMFASDALALTATLDGIAAEVDLHLLGDGRCFFYMPLMHSEQLAHQDLCVERFTAFRRQTSGGPLSERLAANVDFAAKHREIIARFGRFPHRNRLLGRPSTEQERSFLTQPGSSF